MTGLIFIAGVLEPIIPAITDGISTRFVMKVDGEKKIDETTVVTSPDLRPWNTAAERPNTTEKTLRNHLTRTGNLGQNRIMFAKSPTKIYITESLRAPSASVRLATNPIEKAKVSGIRNGFRIRENNAYENIHENRTPLMAHELGLIELT